MVTLEQESQGQKHAQEAEACSEILSSSVALQELIACLIDMLVAALAICLSVAQVGSYIPLL